MFALASVVTMPENGASGPGERRPGSPQKSVVRSEVVNSMVCTGLIAVHVLHVHSLMAPGGMHVSPPAQPVGSAVGSQTSVPFFDPSPQDGAAWIVVVVVEGATVVVVVVVGGTQLAVGHGVHLNATVSL